MRKVHVQVVLDVYVVADDDADVCQRLQESRVTISGACDEVMDIHDITVESTEVTDSR